ncbi:MAG: hypothetical protein ACTSPD_20885 [Promethearchaeota archaeon]
MSYLERTLAWFLKTRIFGGIKKLKQKEYLPFTLIIICVMSFNTIIAILYQLNILISLEFLHVTLIMQLFLSFGIIISGFLIGRIKNEIIYYLIPIILIFLSIFAFFYFDWEYNQVFFQYTKLVYFLIWVAIASISLFVLTLYFFTSFPKKIITLGMPKDHIFFDYVIKILIYISISIYLYMIIQFTFGGILIGTLGILTNVIVLIYIKRAPEKVDKVPGIINFATAIGFFNIFMFYHLLLSFSVTSSSISTLIIDIFFLMVVILYIVQSLTRKIVSSPVRNVPSEKSPVKFQSRLYITDRLRKGLGEKGLVIIIMGLALGYHMVILDSFLISDMPLLTNLFQSDLTINAIYHRIYLFFSFMLIFIAICIFSFSNRFNEFMVDKYTIRQTFKYIIGYFKQPDDDSPSPFEQTIQKLGKKIGDNIKTWKEKWKSKIYDYLGYDADNINGENDE